VNAESQFTVTARGAKDASKDVQGLAGAQERNLVIVRDLSAALKIQEQLLNQLQVARNKATNVDKWRTFNSEIEDTRGTIEQLSQEIQSIKNPNAGGFGGDDASQGIRALSQAFQSFDADSVAGGIGQAFNNLSQFTDGAKDLSEQFETLIPQGEKFFKKLGAGAKDVFKTLSSGNFKAAAGGLKDGLGGIKNSLNSAGAVAILVTANIEVWGRVLEESARGVRDQTAAMERQLEVNKQQREAQREAEGLVEGADVSAYKDAVKQAQKDWADAKQYVDDLTNDIADTDRQFTDLGRSFNPGARKALGEAGEKWRDLLNGQGGALDALNAARIKLDELGNVASDVDAAENARESAERLAQAEQDLADIQKQRSDIDQNLYEQQLQILEDAGREGRRLTEDRQREDTQALEQFVEQQQEVRNESDKRVLEMDKSYREELANQTRDFQKNEDAEYKQYQKETLKAQQQLSDDLLDMVAGLSEQLAEMDSEYAENTTKEQHEYMEVQIDTLADHNKQLAKMDDDAAKERLRRLQDLQYALEDAERGNDVIAFLQAQRDAARDLSRMDEDTGGQRTEAQRDFDDGQTEARESFEKSRTDALAAYQEQRTDAIASYEKSRADRIAAYEDEDREQQAEFAEAKAQRAADLAERLEEMKVAHQQEFDLEKQQQMERLNENQAAFDKQQTQTKEQRRFEDKRREEDAQHTLEVMRREADKQLKQLDEQERAASEIKRNNGVEQAAIVATSQQQITEAYRVGAANAVAAVQGAFAGAGQRPVSGKPVSQKPIKQGKPIKKTGSGRAYAQGGVADRPTLALLGEGRDPEAVVPFDESEGLSAALTRFGGSGGGRALHVTFAPHISAVVGDIATKSVVEDAFDQYTVKLFTGLNAVIQKARSN